jgi:probable rRNA maturation factor
MDNVHYNFIDVKIPDFNPEFFDLWLSKIFVHYDLKVLGIDFVLCNDEELKMINKKYLGHDYYTDVITFNYNEGSSLKGDIYISVDRVEENSGEYGNGNSFDELCRIMVHGVLHLKGLNDKTQRESLIMRREEEACLGLR